MYLAFYGFEEKPFHVTTNPAFCYPSKAHQEAMSHLRYGIQQRLGFLVIAGEVGTGKTTLAKTLVEELGEISQTALVLHPTLTATQLLQTILEDFGTALPPGAQSRGKLLKCLEQFLIAQAERGRSAVLILDEAQAFSTGTLEQLRLLSNIETHQEKLIQMVLIGQPELEKRLQQDRRLRALNQRIAVRHTITPLSFEEVTPYIEHRLRIAGFREETLFTEAAIDMIAKISAGVPRKINLICDQALLAGFVKESHSIDAPLIEEALGVVEPRAVPAGMIS